MNTQNTGQILIVEDEQKLAQLLSDYLKLEHFQSYCINNGLNVIPWVKENEPDLILLDIMLPGKDGMAICKEIRTFSDVPIIMVTARVEEIDRLLGLELGADDYICKPFSPREVVARVKTVLRRIQKSQSGDTEYTTDVLRIDQDKFTAVYHDIELDLTAVEFRLLNTLYSNRGKVYSRGQLLNQLYDDHRIVTERTVDTHIKNLRKKLQAITPEFEVIRSIYGVGYKLEI
jgi:two-component system response regulator BaeR